MPGSSYLPSSQDSPGRSKRDGAGAYRRRERLLQFVIFVLIVWNVYLQSQCSGLTARKFGVGAGRDERNGGDRSGTGAR